MKTHKKPIWMFFGMYTPWRGIFTVAAPLTPTDLRIMNEMKRIKKVHS